MQYLKQLRHTCKVHCTYIVLRTVEKNPKIKMTRKVINGNKKYNDSAYCLNIRLLKKILFVRYIQNVCCIKFMNGINFFSTFQNVFYNLVQLN